MHEVEHLLPVRDLPGSGTIMEPDPDRRMWIAVPGCPAPTLRDRAEDRLLGFVPVGWSVMCAVPRGRVVTCRAEGGHRRVRRYRVRLAAVGRALTVRRV
jgi:hypothetical protein